MSKRVINLLADEPKPEPPLAPARLGVPETGTPSSTGRKCPHCDNGKHRFYYKRDAGEFPCSQCNGTGKLPAKIDLSNVPDNGVFVMYHTVYIVEDRIHDDRTSGGTKFIAKSGSGYTYWWNHKNPKVTYYGPGRVTKSIEINLVDPTGTIEET
jgi:hypothetical protein